MDEPALLFARHKLNVDDYYRMSEVGILCPDARTELIEGEIVDMPSMGPDHAGIVARLNKQLVLACGDRAELRSQLPIQINRENEPEPDFAVCRNRADGYMAGHPGPADVLLLVEVADSSLRFDRTVKLPIYAKAGVPEVWIVDLNARTVDVHRRPSGSAYAFSSTDGPGGRLAMLEMPEIAVDLAAIFY